MADVDEDAPVTSLGNATNDDHDPTDDIQDFRFLSMLGADSKLSKLPKRGEKDFEQHGTKHQDATLEASRQAMHDALAHGRVHIPKNHIRGFFYGDSVENVAGLEACHPENRRGLDGDHIVLVENSKGPHFRTMGRTNQGTQTPKLWLLPEEALYLIERGNLDLWWPPSAAMNWVCLDESTDEDDFKEGTPMSLQAAYAMLIGEDNEPGRVSIERYTVYANLKRTGYVVNRAPSWDPSFQEELVEEVSTTLFSKLWGYVFAESKGTPLPYGPLVQPGLYRSYRDIYERLAIIPRYKPSPSPTEDTPQAKHPFRVDFHVWKPSRIPTYAKSNPGVPDFRIATMSSRSTNVPTLSEIDALIKSTPWSPPDATWTGPGKTYQRLKNGSRHVILAVVDQGIISYLRVGETAFGEEKLYPRFDQGPYTGSKKSGQRGKNRGRG